jgi:hypothetical protein
MAGTINLRQVRKMKARAEAVAAGAANRAAFGRTNAQKADLRARREAMERKLDGARLED